MAKQQQPSATIIPFSRVSADEPEAEIALPTAPTEAEPPEPGRVVDLTGKPKVWLVFGPKAGKTTLLRWAAEETARQGGSAILAACDPKNRSLRSYFEPGSVSEPPGNDARITAGWLRQLLALCASKQRSAMVDLGANQTALDHMAIEAIPSGLAESGIACVAVYMLAPRTDDLADLRMNMDRGFRPETTALVLNHGMTDGIGLWPHHFERVRRHSAYREAAGNGAVELVMPRLDPVIAGEIEAKRLSFVQARDATNPTGRTVTPLEPVDRASVRLWLDGMARNFAPVMSWLPTPPIPENAA